MYAFMFIDSRYFPQTNQFSLVSPFQSTHEAKPQTAVKLNKAEVNLFIILIFGVMSFKCCVVWHFVIQTFSVDN